MFEDIYLLNITSVGYIWSHIGNLRDTSNNLPFGKFSLTKIKNKIYLFGGLKKVGNNTQLSR